MMVLGSCVQARDAVAQGQWARAAVLLMTAQSHARHQWGATTPIATAVYHFRARVLDGLYGRVSPEQVLASADRCLAHLSPTQ